MKWILLFILPSAALAQGFISEQRIIDAVELLEYRNNDDHDHLGDDSFSGKTWSMYLNEKCNYFDRNVQNEDELRAVGLRRCLDGSVSFVQPKSDGWNGWEGKCGQTAASNILFHLCKRALDPNEYVSRYMQDATPGVRPSTLKKGLQKIFKLNQSQCPTQHDWQYAFFYSAKDYIANIKQDLMPRFSHKNLLKITRKQKTYFRNPVIALIQNPNGKYLHWVSIVDVLTDQSRCDFVVNHWNKQYYLPCITLARWAYDVGQSYPFFLKSYSVVRYK